MFKKSMLFTVILTLSSMALAQNAQQKMMAEALAHPDATTTCSVTFSSGTGLNATKFCVTVNGNITQFSVAGQEMIAVGVIGEGYGICDTTTEVSYYDYAYNESGNWGAPTFIHNGNVVTVTRLTSDGIWSLKQTITNLPATAAGPGSAKVSMALKNLSGITRIAILLRYADVDADNDFAGNDFDYTSQTAFGLEPGENRGLAITNNTFSSTIGQITYTQSTPVGPDPCKPFVFAASQPFQGDGSTVQFWDVTTPHNVTKTVISTYKPI
jgi:hypothetical protein